MLESRYINRTQMRKVNSALRAAGYVAYVGDSTTAKPDGCGAGYVSNLIDHIAGVDPDARKEVRKIVKSTIE